MQRYEEKFVCLCHELCMWASQSHECARVSQIHWIRGNNSPYRTEHPIRPFSPRPCSAHRIRVLVIVNSPVFSNTAFNYSSDSSTRMDDLPESPRVAPL
ncbi:hypothetical protein YC2023_052678 [Brassica napus]